jgi:hypothetical protein
VLKFLVVVGLEFLDKSDVLGFSFGRGLACWHGEKNTQDKYIIA